MADFTLFSPAFPSNTINGMTMLDYFAGQAMTGILAATRPDNMYPEVVAEQAIKCAETLIKKLAIRHSQQ